MESLIDAEDFPGRLLHQAALWDNAELLEDLLNGEELSCLNSRDSWGRTPLHAAATSEGSRCLRILIQSGCSVDETCGPRGECRTPLHIASEHGHAANVSLLIEAGAALSSRDALGLTALDLAEKGEHGECMEALRNAANNQEENALKNMEILLQAAFRGDLNLVQSVLLSLGAMQIGPLLASSPNETRSLLNIASECGHVEILTYLLQKGLTPSIHPVTKYSPLHLAALNGHTQVVSLLLKKSPDHITNITIEGRSPLHAAALSGVNSVLETLLQWSPLDLLNALDLHGDSVLSLVASVGSLEMANTLMKYKETLDINIREDSSHETPLHIAVRLKNLPFAKLLLSHDADPNLIIVNKESPQDGFNALTLSCLNRDFALIDLLLKNGAVDEECRALNLVLNNEAIVSKLLASKVRKDPERSIDSKGFQLPLTPVRIDWNHQGGHLEEVRDNWISEACLKINPGLRIASNYIFHSLNAVTHLDLSNNMIRVMPKSILNMRSIKYLSLAANKLESLPEGDELITYNCHSLEEFYVQDNRLDTLPSSIFSLESLSILDASNNKIQYLPIDVWRAPNLKELNLSFNLLNDLQIDHEFNADNMLDAVSSCSGNTAGRSIDEGEDEEDFPPEFIPHRGIKDTTPPTITAKELKRISLWNKSITVLQNLRSNDDSASDVKSRDSRYSSRDSHTTSKGSSNRETSSCLTALNLAHNSFSVIPKCISCFCPTLSRLNLSYNALVSFGSPSSYPRSLKYLDLTHNQIDSIGCDASSNNTFCYRMLLLKNESQSGKVSCAHKKHTRMENLRTLLLSANKLQKLDLTLDGGKYVLFPNLNMLDVSNNELVEISKNISELNHLSVLNLSDNSSLMDLPNEMGLLRKLWNLNIKGCSSLPEPLNSLNHSKTSEVLSYLRSILEHSRPYARMKLMVVGVQGIGKTTLLELLRQESGSKRKPVDHWAKRMGNRGVVSRRGAFSLSTVGVDIGDWTFERRGGSGPITFRTWDFGGQTEYYSTHQYFLSRRSLYLVVWNIGDGEKGVNEIAQWLINIQARAPNSPVLIVGTHYDIIKNQFPGSYIEHLQCQIKEKFINVSDPEKVGLPQVLDSVEVSCKTRHNIKLLANLIYDVCFNLKCPGSKARLLEVKIPATYLALEEIIGYLATDLRNRGLDPVLSQEKFEEAVNHELLSKYKLSFRDSSELSRATKFLHENGCLLHYDDATLRDLYFLDPQWLCDLLSHVVTIREINPFAKNGLMRLEDLKLVFKSSAAISLTAKSYVVNLLNKFEIALTWDSSTLLIPSLLPREDQLGNSENEVDDARVAIPVRNRGFRSRRNFDNYYHLMNSSRSQSAPSRSILKSKQISHPTTRLRGLSSPKVQHKKFGFELSSRSETDHRIQRLFLMSYFPSGFWSRLLSRILGDESVIGIIRSYFVIPEELSNDSLLASIFMENKPEWVCWQSGLELRYLETTLFCLKQIFPKSNKNFYAYHSMKILIQQQDDESSWTPLENASSSILELSLPQDTVVLKRAIRNEQKEEIGYTASVLDPNPKSVSQLLALAVEHIDTLLEDWYPSLGTRFLHTSEGRMLVTRIVPCPRCLISFKEIFYEKDKNNSLIKRRSIEDLLGSKSESWNSMDESSPPAPPPIYAFPIEECILNAFKSTNPACFVHGDLLLGQIAPDIVFLDLDERIRISHERLKRGELLGSGSFGFVYKSVIKTRGMHSLQNVAVKMLQPSDPGSNASDSSALAYQISHSKWSRDPCQYAAKAYVSARQEISILLQLKHPNIVPLVGVCVNPLSIVLELAPFGSLDRKIAEYYKEGRQIPVHLIRAVILQISRALEYLHQLHIIYRDLKSENVLIWRFSEKDSEAIVKLADYGISRPTLPSGTKGFGGTEGFMAPEIIRYNGEEEYTEKVDCFSFGMFIYELLTRQQPFSGYETIKDLILEGDRPPISFRETIYPTNLLDLMIICWSQLPRFRPSTSQLVSIISAPEFSQLIDVISIGLSSSSSSAQILASNQELWLSIDSAFDSSTSSLNCLKFSSQKWLEHLVFATELESSITALCLVEDKVWVGDNLGYVHAFALSSDYSKTFTYKMDPDSRNEASPVRSIHYLSTMRRVCIALHNGRMFLCDSEIVPSSRIGGEGLFVKSELGSSSCIHSIASIRIEEGILEIWCGESHGSLSIFSFNDGVVTSQRILNHINPIIENLLVLQVISNGIDSVWTALYPGFHVYQWSSSDKTLVNKLDCSKLVPVSESLKTISIEESFNPSRCQITSLTHLRNRLYVGTNWGCLIIAESSSLQPLTVFRPYSGQVQALIPIESKELLISFGKGYRSLIPRYVSTKRLEDEDSLEDGGYLGGEDYNETNTNMFGLLWSTQTWAY